LNPLRWASILFQFLFYTFKRCKTRVFYLSIKNTSHAVLSLLLPVSKPVAQSRFQP